MRDTNTTYHEKMHRIPNAEEVTGRLDELTQLAEIVSTVRKGVNFTIRRIHL